MSGRPPQDEIDRLIAEARAELAGQPATPPDTLDDAAIQRLIDETKAQVGPAPRSKLSSFLTGVTDPIGATDELAALGTGIAGLLAGDTRGITHMGKLRREMAETIGRERTSNPKTFMAGQLLGGVPVAAALPGGPIAGGALYGGLAGGFSAEGDATDRAIGAGLGGATGAAGGAAAKYVVAPAALAAAGAIRRGVQAASPTVVRAAELAGQKVKNFLAPAVEQEIPGEIPSSVLREQGKLGSPVEVNPLEYYREKITPADRSGRNVQLDAVAGEVPTKGRAAGTLMERSRAKDLLLKAAQADKKSIADALREAERTPATEPLTLNELFGDNVRGLSRGARAVPSDAKSTIPAKLLDRVKKERGLLRSSLEGAAGAKAGDPELMIQEALDRITEKAGPVYQEAYAHGAISKEARAELTKLLQTREGRIAYKEARLLAKEEGHTLPKIQKVTLTGSMAGGKGPTKLQYDFVEAPDVRTVDYTKQVMDEVIRGKMAKGPGAGGISRKRGIMLLKKKDALLARLDQEVPKYGEARNIAKSEYDLRRAVKLGSKFLTTDDRQIARMVGKFTQGEKEAYTRTALDAINKQIKKTGDLHDVYQRVFGNEFKRDALKAVMGDEAFAQLSERMQAGMKRMDSKRFILGGSNTVDKAGEQFDIESGGIPSAALQLAMGRPSAAMKSLGTSVLANRLKGVTRETANELSPILTAGSEGGDIARQSLLQQLRALRDYELAQAPKRAAKETIAKKVRPLSGIASSYLAPKDK